MRKTGYKERRTTIVLAASSAKYRGVQDESMRKAFEEAREKNFDLDLLNGEALETFYARLDDGVMEEIRGEFIFLGGQGSIRDHKACTAICELCGKGDSRDDGANEDKLRYDFYLHNAAGGKGLWAGSSCIINFGLKVKGAETSEDARLLLAKTLREHIQAWKEEAWRQSYVNHEQIPSDYQKLIHLQRHVYETESSRRWCPRWKALLEMLEKNDTKIRFALQAKQRDFRTAARFYSTRRWLTPIKHEIWISAKRLMAEIEWMLTLYREVEEITQDVSVAKDHYQRSIDSRKPKRRPNLNFAT